MTYDYETQRAIERKVRAERVELFTAAMHGALAALGAGWSYAPRGDDQEYWTCGYLTGPDLETEHGAAPRSLFVSLDTSGNKGPRISISGLFPGVPTADGRETVRTWRDLATYAERESGVAHQISVALSRKPAAIAADIQRRLMPTYAEFLARAIEANAERVAHLDSGKRNAERLAAACGGAAIDSRDGIEYAIRASGLPMIRVNGDSVRFEYLYCTPDQAVQIAAILHKGVQS